MIFVGDVSLPNSKSIDLINLPTFLKSLNWFINLEGALIEDGDFFCQKAVYNNFEAFKQLITIHKICGVSLANNHIFDVGSYEYTLSLLNKLQIPFCGIGSSVQEAAQPLFFIENDVKVAIISFGWEVIQCEVASNNKTGVNPLTKCNVCKKVTELISEFPNIKIIPFMHWSYELEAEPQPFERELAKHLIDIGAAGVIGSHPHRIGGFELYKGKPIVYSLGNWLFKQKHYFNGKLSFPDFCNLELAFEWDLTINDFRFHFFEYDRDKSTLSYVRTEDKNSPTMLLHTPFRDLTDKEYIKWYKKNHYHKNKGLPIYYWDDSVLKVKMKNDWNKTRDFLLKILLNRGK